MFSIICSLCLACSLGSLPPASGPRPLDSEPPAAGIPEARDAAVSQEMAGERDPLVTDRPDATESAETVAPGGFQLETGYTLARVDSTDAHSLGEILLRVGVVDDLELRAGFNSYEWVAGPGGDANGFADTFVGLKWQVAEAGPAGSGRPAIAILAGTSLPSGADELSDGAAQPEVLVAAGWDLDDSWSVGANLGWGSRKDRELDERFSELRSSIAVGYGINDRWGAYFEYFGAYGLAGREDESLLNAGLTYLISHDLQLDGRVGHGLNGRDEDFFVGFGAAVRW